MPLMFLNGGAMRGGPLHHLLRGAPFAGTVRTAARYRFYSVGDRFPMLAEHDPKITGLSDEDGSAERAEGSTDGAAECSVGVSVVGELYDVPWDVLRESLLPAEPAELELGVIELADGSGALAMLRRRAYTEPDPKPEREPEHEAEAELRDISEYADWRAYLASTSVASTATSTSAPTGE